MKVTQEISFIVVEETRMIFIKEKILYEPSFLLLHKSFPITVIKCYYF